MIKLSEGGMTKAKTGWKVGLLGQIVKWWMPRESFWRNESAIPVNTQRKLSLIADMEKMFYWSC